MKAKKTIKAWGVVGKTGAPEFDEEGAPLIYRSKTSCEECLRDGFHIVQVTITYDRTVEYWHPNFCGNRLTPLP